MTTLDGYMVELDQNITMRLTCVVALIDAYTGKPPIGAVTFMLEDRRLKVHKTTDNFYYFLNLAGKEFEIHIQTEYYAEAVTEKKTLPRTEPRDPIAVTLQPTPAYPFPSGATLIRGMVQNSKKEAVSGARIEIEGEWSQTTPKGEFVLYFTRLKSNNLLLDSEKPDKCRNKDFLKGKAGKTISVKATCDSQKGIQNLEYVEIGKTTTLKSPIVVL
jgi:hypothetical protein